MTNNVKDMILPHLPAEVRLVGYEFVPPSPAPANLPGDTGAHYWTVEHETYGPWRIAITDRNLRISGDWELPHTVRRNLRMQEQDYKLSAA